LSSRSPAAVIFGCAGPTLAAAERDFFRDADPLGFILFQRNCETPAQVRRLVTELRNAVGRADAPVLIDQEGGRVARLKPPHWPAYPSAAAIAALGGGRAAGAAWTAARLIADDLSALGITVDCLPVLDIPVMGADNVIGDRAYGQSPDEVTFLGGVAAQGLLAGGVLPVMKHMPGHGRALVDSHRALPRVTAPRDVLEASDFAPFRELAQLPGIPLGMTAHVVYEAIDSEHPATLSARVIAEVIRASIGFNGLLFTDDLSMGALGGSLAARASAALQAGCDVVLHCNGEPAEMTEIAGVVAPLTDGARERWARAESMGGKPNLIERAALEEQLRTVLGSGV
jgi:beta-N-acetylhexosaminidase